MPANIQRFILRRTQADAWLIKDLRDGSVVCFVHKGKRPLERTQAMVTCMLDALNRTGAPATKGRGHE